MTKSLSAIASSHVASQSTIPPLENGDRLTMAEFENRYTAMSHLKKEVLQQVLEATQESGCRSIPNLERSPQKR
ncbi:MAG: hypothetical protein AAGA80_16115 [Cyanobacteria bacterium P01_F01_bin.143]